LGQDYDWLYTTTPQANAGGRTLAQPRGKLLGGSSAVNGMYIVRPSQNEFDAWRDLIAPADSSAAGKWGWDSFFPALKGTENFSEPGPSVAAYGMKWTASSHGTSGKLHTSFPGYMVPITNNWLPTLQAAGIPAISDAYGGSNIGGFFATSAINPANWTRSYSKSAYIDTLPPRSNLHIISGATVEKVSFADNVQDGARLASGVDFSTGRGSAIQSVSANKEVILSGGAMGSPHLLQVSGVGPKDVLDGAGVPLKVELPGVGQHMMDHVAAGVYWKTSEQTQGDIRASGSDLSKTPEFNSFINSGIAYINGSRLFESEANFASFRGEINSNLGTLASTLVPSQYKEVVEGYKAIYDATANKIHPNAGLVEILLSINAPGQVAVQAALQQPMSQGRIYINSSSIYDKPVIDPQYFSHPADIVILRQGIKLARTLGATAPLSSILTEEVTPGPTVQSDPDIETWLRNTIATEYHPAGTCAMLPKEKGGVVDANLKVYGTLNLRVVDSSVFPVSFSAHVMAPTYALAERAASLIQTAHNPNSSGSSGGSTGSSGGSNSNTGQNHSGAVGRMMASGWLLALGSVAAGVALSTL